MSKFKKIATKGINPSMETRDFNDYTSYTGNIYKTITVLGKRSSQLSLEMKRELQSKLDEFASSTDNLEEIHENREQIEISKFYERLPHTTLIAQDELFDNEIYHQDPVSDDV